MTNGPGSVDTVVLPLAGFGTRLLPLTKSVPKGLLRVGQRTVLDHVLEEAMSAGYRRFILVVGHDGDVYRDYLSINGRLRKSLQAANRTFAAEQFLANHRIPSFCEFVDQPRPDGLGDAIRLAARRTDGAPFALVVPDTLIFGTNALRDIAHIWAQENTPILSLARADQAEVSKYGIIRPGMRRDGALEILDIVEKPQCSDAPSDLYFNGRAILTPDIVRALDTFAIPHDRELTLTDALRQVLPKQKIFGQISKGVTFDCGSFDGLVEASAYLSKASSPALELQL